MSLRPDLPADISTETFLQSFAFPESRITWMNHIKYGYPKSMEKFLAVCFDDQIAHIRKERLNKLRHPEGLTGSRERAIVIDSLKVDEKT